MATIAFRLRLTDDRTTDRYNHPFAVLVGKEDNQTNPDAPYFIELFSTTLRAGVRSAGTYGFVIRAWSG